MSEATSVSGDLLPKGTLLTGKWTRQKIEVLDTLGVGANGQVYQVRTQSGYFAMKVAPGAGDVAFEWHLLETLAKSTKHFPRPVFIDDSNDNPPHYFYLMEKVEGKPVQRLFQSYTPEQIGRLAENILLGLADLHRTQHAFCDVKPENILVTSLPMGNVRFVDVGGVTPFGRSVRQYTPFYDRAFWGLGSRISDATYDLAALALMLICLCSQPPIAASQWTEKERNHWLRKAVRRFTIPSHIPLLEKALEGQFRFAGEWVQSLRTTPLSVSRRSQSAAPVHLGSSSPTRTIGTMNYQAGLNRASATIGTATVALSGQPSAVKVPKRHRVDWTEWVMWWTLAVAVVTTFTAWASFLGWL